MPLVEICRVNVPIFSPTWIAIRATVDAILRTIRSDLHDRYAAPPIRRSRGCRNAPLCEPRLLGSSTAIDKPTSVNGTGRRYPSRRSPGMRHPPREFLRCSPARRQDRSQRGRRLSAGRGASRFSEGGSPGGRKSTFPVGPLHRFDSRSGDTHLDARGRRYPRARRDNIPRSRSPARRRGCSSCPPPARHGEPGRGRKGAAGRRRGASPRPTSSHSIGGTPCRSAGHRGATRTPS